MDGFGIYRDLWRWNQVKAVTRAPQAQVARPPPWPRHLSLWLPGGPSRRLPKLPVFLVAQKNRVKSATYFDLRRY